MIKEDLDDLEVQMRRRNLLLYAIEDAEGEAMTTLNENGSMRPTFTGMRQKDDRNTIMKAASNRPDSEGKRCPTMEDLPPRIIEKRKKHIPFLINARNKNMRAKLQGSRLLLRRSKIPARRESPSSRRDEKRDP